MSDRNFLTQGLENTVLSRRTFLKWSAALGGTAALAGSGLDLGLAPVQAAPAAVAPAGKWVLGACWHNCGGRCANFAYVADGVVVRQKQDDTHPDSPDYPQMRGCARGHSQRYQVFGADRIKYPMKRKNWAPGGGDKSLRGKDEWVRISWDEALTTVANEIIRIQGKYGIKSIWAAGTEITRTLGLFGGYVSSWGGVSRGTWTTSASLIGANSWGINDRFDYRKSKLIVMWGENPIWASGGNVTYNYLQAKKAGAKFIFIDPFYNDSAVALADEWIPIRPATDMTMLLAIAHVLLTEDNPTANPLIDWDFLNRCTSGFDKAHLPTGADPEDNFKDYVLGLDATGKAAPSGHKNYPAKTPEWAAEICGVPPEKIRSLAREMATTKPTAFLWGYAPARVNQAQGIPQAVMTVGAMIGSMGMPGGSVGPITHGRGCDRASEAPLLTKLGDAGVPGISNPIASTRLNNNETWDAVLTGKYRDGVGDKKDINIQLIYNGSGNALQTKVGMNKGIAAHRIVEFVVTQNYVLTTAARYSDIVLPVTTQWERYGWLSDDLAFSEMRFFASQVTQPLFESKDDIWIAVEIGKRLGMDPKKIDPVPLNQQIFNQLAGAQVIAESGSGYEKLVTITDADIAEMGVQGKPQTGRVSIKDFKDKGTFQLKRSSGDNYGYVAFAGLRKDPKANPLATASGKLEIHCQKLADTINAMGWSTIRPIPTYMPPTEGYEETFSDWNAKVKGPYPLQLYTIHYARRSHTIFDSIPHLRRAFPNEFFMNPMDAVVRGIKQGDTVLITSRHGKVLRPVFVTERLIPGVVNLPHGAWVEMDETTGIDKAGADNIIGGDIPTVEGHEGWNSCNVQVEKWTGTPLTPDYTWPQRIPFEGV